jgi:hypothetical protein
MRRVSKLPDRMASAAIAIHRNVQSDPGCSAADLLLAALDQSLEPTPYRNSARQAAGTLPRRRQMTDQGKRQTPRASHAADPRRPTHLS